ncbi:hypothetical protein JT089_01385 [Helicobacter pylori]|nr:hypothetical protein [Helicobacter pylori]
MSSDFKNLFIGANNSKRTQSNLLDSEKGSINSNSLSSLIDARLLRNTRKLEANYLSLKSLSILTNPYPPN